MKGKCKRCGKKAILQAHHILPRSLYKQSGIKIYLCKECHKRVHQNLEGKRKC